MENNSFEQLNEDMDENDFPMEEMRLNIANEIQSFRQIGDVFGNFFYQITHFFIVFFGGKPRQ